MPRLDGKPSASDRLFTPRRFVPRSEAERGVETAHTLVRLGAAVFVARPALSRHTGEWWPSSGHGGSGYWLPKEWEQTPVDPHSLNRWRYGDALGMITGQAFDVLDVDPRNGGNVSLEELLRLGIVPTDYGRAATPSGGEHRLIAPTGVRKTSRRGLDLQAGDRDGKGRGFVWIAPTVRRSKVDNEIRAYRWTHEPTNELVVPDQATDLLAWFAATDPTSSAAELASWSGGTDRWLALHTTGDPISPLVERAVRPFIDGEPFAGHARMLKFQTHLVKLATKGHVGVSEALGFARTVWLDTPHSSDEDPAVEWDVALRHAIQKYGGTSS